MNRTIIILIPELNNEAGMQKGIEKIYDNVLSYVGTKNSSNKLGEMPDYPVIGYKGILTKEEKKDILDIVSDIASPLFIEGNLAAINNEDALTTIKL